jgi:hypothetical protein
MAAMLTLSVAGAAAQDTESTRETAGVRTGTAACGEAGRTHSRILASPDRSRQVWAELVTARDGNRCRLRWLLHVSTTAGQDFRVRTVLEAPPLGEGNGFDFEIVGFAAGSRRVLAVQNERRGEWASRTAVVYDFDTGSVLTQDVNGRVERLAPDDCPVDGRPTGLVSDDTVALVVVSTDDAGDDAFRCWPEARWGLHMRTGELRRLSGGERVMTGGAVLGHPRGPAVSGSVPGP